jgi:hypothetical protein
MDMGLRRRTVLGLLAAGLALPLVGCSSSDESPSPATSAPTATSPTTGEPGRTPTLPAPVPTLPGGGNPAPEPPPPGKAFVSLERSGGIAGRVLTVVVQPDGRWIFTGGKPGESVSKPLTGRLDDARQQRLQQLLADPKLQQEAKIKRGQPTCRDGFHYTLSTGALLVSWDACSAADEPPTATAVAKLLAAATPF